MADDPHGLEVLVLERRETRIVDAVLGEFRGQECEPACVQGGPQAPRVALGVRHVRKSGEKSCTDCLRLALHPVHALSRVHSENVKTSLYA